MFYKKFAIRVFNGDLRKLVRFTSTEDLLFKPKFSSIEQEKILSTLNEANSEQLSRFDVSQARIKNLEAWRIKNGPFRSLNEILEVEGLGEKVLEKLCVSIITQIDRSSSVVPGVGKNGGVIKNQKQILSPVLSLDLVGQLKNAVGIHLAPMGVSWAKLSCENNELNMWSYHDFKMLPKKLLPTDTFEMATILINQIPPGEIYVFESSTNLGITGGKSQPTTYTQQLELSSMLLAMLNIHPKHNDASQINNKTFDFTCENKVYYLRTHLPARLFRTLVGNERVAATEIIANLLDNKVMPCTAITVNNLLKNHYMEQPPAHRDLMGQALMLVITFMDLCIYRNPSSFAALAPGRRSK